MAVIWECGCCGDSSPSASGFWPTDDSGREVVADEQWDWHFDEQWDWHFCGACNKAGCPESQVGSPCQQKQAAAKPDVGTDEGDE